VKATTPLPRVEVSPQRSALTSRAGAVLLGGLADKPGLTEGLTAALRVRAAILALRESAWVAELPLDLSAWPQGTRARWSGAGACRRRPGLSVPPASEAWGS